MTERIQKSKSQQKREEVVEEVKKTDSKEELKDELDELLDEIDSVLEVNAAEFVAAFIQKGGQISRTFWENVKRGFNISTRKVVQSGTNE